jgi:flagellar assembly protein FliH
MTVASPKKFLFEVSFDQVDGEAPPRRAIEKRYTRAEIEATRAAALAEGRQAGLDEAAAGVDSLAAEALDAIAHGIETLIAGQDATTIETQRRALDALRAIIAKTFPALAARDPLAEIEAFAAKCLHDAIDEPRIVLRVPAPLYDTVQARLSALGTASGYAGRIVLLADDALAGGDARIEWADGGSERNLDRQRADIDSVLARPDAPTPGALTRVTEPTSL